MPLSEGLLLKSLSGLQHRQLEILLSPLAAQVAQLVMLVERAGVRKQGSNAVRAVFPDLTRQAVTLLDASERLAVEIQTFTLSSERPDTTVPDEGGNLRDSVNSGRDKLVRAANGINDAIQSINASEQQGDQDAFFRGCDRLIVSSRSLLDSSICLLSALDAGEKRKLIRAAYSSLDRLGLVAGVRSMRGLLVCFKGFAESVVSLLELVESRKQDTTDVVLRDKLSACVDDFKQRIPVFSQAMQMYVRNPAQESAVQSRDYSIEQVKRCLENMVEAVDSNALKSFEESASVAASESSYMSPSTGTPHVLMGSVEVVKRSLQQVAGGEELDEFLFSRDLERVARDSTSIAMGMRDRRREDILVACDKLRAEHSMLSSILRNLRLNPNDEALQQRMEGSAEMLYKWVDELDQMVRRAVLEETVKTFANTDPYISELIEAGNQDDETVLNQRMGSFREHATKLIRMSNYAASKSAEELGASRIRYLTEEIEKLSPKLTKAAEVAFRTQETAKKEHLSILGREWQDRVKGLTQAVDDVIDLREFVVVCEDNIYFYVTQCRDAFKQQDSVLLNSSVIAVKAHCQRVLDICRTEQLNREDELFCRALSNQAQRLERVLTRLDVSVAQAATDMTNDYSQTQVANSCREICQCIKEVRQLVQGRGRSTVHKDEALEWTEASWTSQSPSGGKKKNHMLATHPLSKSHSPPRQLHDTLTSSPIHTQTEGDTLQTPPGLSALSSRNYSDISPGSRKERLAWKFTHDDTSLQSRETTQHYQETPLDVLARKSTEVGAEAKIQESNKLQVEVREGWSQTSPDIPVVLETSHPYYLFALPIVGLVKYIVLAQPRQLESQCTSLTARTLKLVSLCDETIESWKYMGLPEARLLRQASQQVTTLTPQIIEEAQMLSEQSQAVLSEEDILNLVDIAREWVGKMAGMLEPLEKFLTPWSHLGHSLLELVMQGKRHRLDRELERLRALSMSVAELGEVSLESLNLLNTTGEARELDRAQHKQKIHSLCEEMRQITPLILECTRELPVRKEDIVYKEQLAVMCMEWSAKVNGILSCADQLSAGVNQPANFLLVSIEESASHTIIQASVADLKYFTGELKEIGNAAISGCTDQNTLRQVRGAAREMERILIKVTSTVEGIELEPNKLHLRENLEVQLRHWGVKAAIITCLVDELTLQVSGPVDQLGGIALAINLADSSVSREELKEQLENISGNLSRKLTQMCSLIDQVNEPVQLGANSLIRPIKATLNALKTATSHLIDSTISFSENSDQENIQIFRHRRRQWTSLLLKTIFSMDAVENSEQISQISGVVHEMLLDGISEDPIVVDESYPPEAPSHPPPHPMKFSTSSTQMGTVKEKYENIISPYTMLSPENIGYISHTEKVPSYKVKSGYPTDSIRDKTDHNIFPTDESHGTQTLGETGGEFRDSLLTNSPTTGGYSAGSLASVARRLHRQTEMYMDVGNPFLDVAKKLTQLMLKMSELARSRGNIESKIEMINIAKKIALNAQEVVELATLLANQSADKRMRTNLCYYADMIPTFSNQLRILADVKASMPNDRSADIMLVKNAQNLIDAVSKTIRAAEATCVKGLKPSEDPEIIRTIQMANKWKHKVYYERVKEIREAKKSALGLRVYPEKESVIQLELSPKHRYRYGKNETESFA